MRSYKDDRLSTFNEAILTNTFNHELDGLNELVNYFINMETQEAETILQKVLDREMLISILDSLPIGVQITDANGIIKYVNDAFLSIVGVKKKDRLGKSIFDVSNDGSISKVLKAGKPVTNLRNYPKNTSVELVSSGAPIFLDGKMIGALAVVNDVNEVISLSKQLEESKKLVRNLSEKVKDLAGTKYNIDDIIGESELMRRVKEQIKLASSNDATVLILGETGTGKELVAESIHSASLRSNNPFIGVNCSAIPENLLESELFGYEKGSFTGAIKTKLGKFELANGGTLFLDEIGDMDIKLQSKILKAIEEKEIQRIGGEYKIPLDIRIIAATNRDLKRMVSEGDFRQDLYYRLNVLTIEVPPLREHTDDIEELCQFLINKKSRKIGKKGITINQEAIEVMKEYYWPGNVRELENILERIVINSNNWHEINACDLNIILNNDINCYKETLPKVMNLKDAEKMIISQALRKHGTSYEGKQKAADVLGISIATLYNKLKEYNIS